MLRQHHGGAQLPVDLPPVSYTHLLPTFIAGLFHARHAAVHNLIEGAVKIAIFLGYLILCSRPVSYTHLDVYKRQLRALRRAGFNRISLGVQSSDDETLRQLGRVHRCV